MSPLYIGWPEGIWMAISLFGLGSAAMNHGKPRDDKYNFHGKIFSLIVYMVLLYFGGFFTGPNP